jgi:hypothetical protein
MHSIELGMERVREEADWSILQVGSGGSSSSGGGSGGGSGSSGSSGSGSGSSGGEGARGGRLVHPAGGEWW